ncbi:MAG: asparagine synthase (glutamine-hydrolyzing) [Tumebacillaceae bacterium]
MTGIAGIHNWKRETAAQQETIVAMTNALSHRRIGVDETLAFTDANLSLTAGALWTENGVTVAVEGFLYNHEEIGRELASAGYRLKENGLAEVMVGAYLQWGDAFAERLYGAFAFVLWDVREQKLLLGRDQLGIKPLYFAELSGEIVIGSEIKAVLEHPQVTRDMDSTGLIEMLALGQHYTPGLTLFRDVQEVKAGHIVVCTPNGSKSVGYWDVTCAPHEDSFGETVEKLHDMLDANVRRLVQLNLSETSILSGGLDSSGMIAMAVRARGNDYKTFSGNTPESYENVTDPEERDSHWVIRVADYLGITNEEVLVNSKVRTEALARYRRAFDLPSIGQYDNQFYHVFQGAREQGYRSMLVGEAADELIGSLTWFRNQQALDRQNLPWFRPANTRLASGDVLNSLRVEEYVQDRYADHMRRTPRMAGESAEDTRLREMLYLTIKGYLPTIFRRNDRLAMSLNMNVSMPFADPRFAQYAYNMPWEMKNHGGRMKGVLRESFRPLLPEDVVYRKKSDDPMVFSSAFADQLHDEYEQLLQDSNAPLYDLIDRNEVRKLLDAKEMHEDLMLRWRFDYYLQANHWMRDYKVTLR